MLHRTTFRIDEDLLAEAKALAARQHRSLNSVMEEALRRLLASNQERENRPPVELPTWGTPGKGPHLTPEDIKEVLAQQDIEHFLEVSADDARRHERDDLRPPA
jgi:predicted transcriptional regulator